MLYNIDINFKKTKSILIKYQIPYFLWRFFCRDNFYTRQPNYQHHCLHRIQDECGGQLQMYGLIDYCNCYISNLVVKRHIFFLVSLTERFVLFFPEVIIRLLK